jgi:hypothetical protein
MLGEAIIVSDMNQREVYVNYFMVYLLLFTSGSHRYFQSPDKFLVLIFMVSVLIWTLFTERKINKGFVLYVVAFMGFQLIINLYTDGGLSLSSIISTTIRLTLAYLILKIVGREFASTFVNLVVLLAVVSLFGYLSDTFGMFGNLIRMLPRVGDIGYEGFLYLFQFQDHIDRNNSIYFEPGAYQAFINAGLFLLFFVDMKLSLARQRIYILILLATLLTTFSTTGILIFAIIFCLFLLKSTIMTASGKFALVGVILSAIVIFAAQFQHVVFEKINDFIDVEDITDSSNLRSFDALVDMEIFKRHLFGVGYDEYVTMVSSIGLISAGQTSSNGITRTLAIYGFPFSLFLFASYYLALRRLLGGGLMSITSFMILLMFFLGESWYVFSPFCLMIIAASFLSNQLDEDDEVYSKDASTL